MIRTLFSLALGGAFVACLASAGCSGSAGGDGTATGTSGNANGDTGSSGSSGASSGKTVNKPPPAPTGGLPPADATPCVTATYTLCAKACACTGAGSCIVAYGTSATEEHDSFELCQRYYASFVCGAPDSATGFARATCATDLGAATCVTTKKGSALDFPMSCEPPRL